MDIMALCRLVYNALYITGNVRWLLKTLPMVFSQDLFPSSIPEKVVNQYINKFHGLQSSRNTSGSQVAVPVKLLHILSKIL